MDAELQDFKNAAKEVGDAVRTLNDKRKALHAAVEAEADKISRQITADIANALKPTTGA